MIIEIKDICKTYKTGPIEVKALRHINLEVEKNEFVAIMGASGSGKSTLMNIIGCLDRATSGEYELEGINISKLNDAELARIRNKKIGFVFQSFNLLPRMTALMNVEIPMVYAGVPAKERRKRAIEALSRVNLADRMNHKPNELSGGQKQKVAIARALVNNPTIILADEPTGNLDSFSGEEVMAVFQELNKEGVTLLLVTHEMDIAQHAKRIITFRDGQMIKDVIVENTLIANDILALKKAKAVNQ
ncbi:ABC transporter ATP-binding protein [Aceticella autotrophica]|uniref:ABC transporter ATP-binding protein n=1 Tax=Aceticella autotrophica TaxID=2755338 RepID=UPI0032B56F17